MARMADVAKEAGVSIKTVSRVLNDEPYVNAEKKARVLAAVKSLGYVPGPYARALKSKRTYSIHFIAHCTLSNYVNAIQTGSLLACQERGYGFVFNTLSEDILENPAALTDWFETHMLKHRPDGVVLVAPYTDHEDLNRLLGKHDIPVAKIGPNQSKGQHLTVTLDEFSAAKTMTEYLISLGHTDIAYIHGLQNQRATHERYQGYLSALKEADITAQDQWVLQGDFLYKSGFEAGEKLMAMAQKPSAVFAANDEMAAGVIGAALKNNIRVPDELSVAGFDNSEAAEMVWPALTTIHQPRVEIAKRAVSHLIRLNGKASNLDKPIDILDHELIIRGSTSEQKP